MDGVTQVLFGMENFAVLAAVINPLDGELGVLVETINPARGCPGCGVVGCRDLGVAARQFRHRH